MRNKRKTVKSVCWLLMENGLFCFEEQNEEQNEDINNIRVTRLEKQKKQPPCRGKLSLSKTRLSSWQIFAFTARQMSILRGVTIGRQFFIWSNQISKKSG